MSFFDKIKSVFGLETYEDELIQDGIAPEEVSQPQQFDYNNKPSVADPAMPLTASPEVVAKIFDKVVEITNSAIPAYFANSVNAERQKKYLYDALDQSIKDYLTSLEVEAQKKCKALWQKERDELKIEMNNLKQRTREVESKRSELNEQKLSADRQRRALSERVHDLESKVIQLEAEKEQYEIENRSLINKAKVANVFEADNETLRKELEQLKKQMSGEIADDENNRLKDEVTHLREQITQLNDAVEAAKVKDEMGNAMVNDLQKRASDSQQTAKDLNAKVEQLTQEISLRDAQIADLKKEVADRDAQIAEDDETINEIQALAEQLEAFEEVKTKLQDKIKALKEELKEAHKDNEMLKSTIKTNLYSHAQQEQAMKQEIEQLKTPPSFDRELGSML